jgi:cytidylate kinase
MVSLELLVLISGPIAVGKTTLRQALTASYGFDYVRSGDYLKQLAAQRGLAGERTALQDLGDELDQLTDFRWLLDEVAKPGIAAAPTLRRWLVDAVRKRRQVEHFRTAYDRAVLHAHLTASEDVLRQRYAERKDAAPYDVVIQHENEVASRNLIVIADLIIDTSSTPAEEAALQITAMVEPLAREAVRRLHGK